MASDRLLLELKDKVEAAPGSPELAAEDEEEGARPVAWRQQVQQGLQALGWSAKDAGIAVTKLDGQAAEGADVRTLLKQAIQLLGKA